MPRADNLMRDQSHHHGHLPKGASGHKNNLGGAAFSSLAGQAERQLAQLELAGALFAEKVPTPLLIKNPLDYPTPTAIILTRWIGGNVFGVIFPDTQGATATGIIPITLAMHINPGLTPSGTMSSEPWDKNIFTQRDHLFPRPQTIQERARKAAQGAATELLKQFPHRIDLSPHIETDQQEHGKVLKICGTFVAPLEKEISRGVRIPELVKSEDSKIHQLLQEVVNSLVHKTVIFHALRFFAEERLRVAREQRDSGLKMGAIHELTTLATAVTATILSPIAAKVLREEPFALPPMAEIRHQSTIGVAITVAQHRPLHKLWRLLNPVERDRISTKVAHESWKKAVHACILRN